MGNTYDRVAHRYFGRLIGDTDRDNLRNPRMPIRRINGVDTICSYGDWFPLAMPIEIDKDGHAGAFLLNGDRSTMTTMTRHQPVIRDAVAGTGLPSVIIPFSALNSAGIDPTSVRIVEVTKDRFETIPVVTYDFPEGAVWGEIEVMDKPGDWDRDGNPWVERFSTRGTWSMPWNGIQYRLLHALREEDQRRRGRTTVRGQVTHREPLLFLSERDRREGRSYRSWQVEALPDGRTKYSRSYTRHWLGESLISAEVAWTERVRCKQCKGSGRFPDDGPRPQFASDEWCRECWGRGSHAVTKRRRTKFLSGFDANEARPSYFLCELPPKSKASTIEEAYESLKPDAVRLAEQMGREVLRQGDVFLIPTALTKRELTKKGGVAQRHAFVLGTNHRATEVVTADGVTLIRGTLRHDPAGRRPDHRRVAVGKSWHLAVKNTTPVAART